MIDLSSLRKKMKGYEPSIMEIKRHSALLIPFTEQEGELCLLFELRSGNVSQPGEVCFPGGGMEEGENPVQAALREAEEELGLASEDIELLGQFDSLVLYTNMALHCSIAFVRPEALERMRPCEREVAGWFTLPVSWLMENSPYIYEYKVNPLIGDDFPYEAVQSPDKYNWKQGSCTVPIWNYKGYCLWGITARIVLRLLEFLA